VSIGRHRPQDARSDVLAFLGGIGRAYPLGHKPLINHGFLCKLSYTSTDTTLVYCSLHPFHYISW
jgi:hypothetical protein